MRGLITGATGFIGSHLTERLVKEGWDISILVRRNSHLEHLSEAILRRVQVLVIGSEDFGSLINKAKPDVVFHLATHFLSEHKTDDIEPMVEGNITLGTKLLDAMEVCGCNKFVYARSSWQHGLMGDYEPVNLYAATKEAFDTVLEYYREVRGLEMIALTIYDTYGTPDYRTKLLPYLNRIAGTEERIPMSPGEQCVDFVHVDDVTAGFELAAQYLLEGKSEMCGNYAIATGNPIPLRELVARYEKLLGKKINVDWGARPYRKREVMRPSRVGEILPGWQREHHELM